MFTLFLGLTIGYCANKYTVIETLDDGKTANVEIIFGSFIKGCLWIFAVLGAVANWAIATGRNVRSNKPPAEPKALTYVRRSKRQFTTS